MPPQKKSQTLKRKNENSEGDKDTISRMIKNFNIAWDADYEFIPAALKKEIGPFD